MKVLALDISTSTGWALFEGSQLVEFSLLVKPEGWHKKKPYPWNFSNVVEEIGLNVEDLVDKHHPDTVVIEEINKTSSRFGSRFSQKLLDMIHGEVIRRLGKLNYPVKFVNTSTWRGTLGLSVAATRKTAKPFVLDYAKLKKQFDKASKVDKKILKVKLDVLKKDLKLKCIFGKIDKKSISVAHVNLKYGKMFLKGDNDITDAICLGEAFVRGCPIVTNEEIFG